MRTRILCLEGEWDEKHQDVTVEPLLKLLQNLDAWNNDNRRQLTVEHHLCQSVKRLKHKLQGIDQRSFPNDTAFNCLHLAFHGNKCGLHTDGEAISFEEIADCIGDKARGKIVFFSSCGERGQEKKLEEFKQNTGAQLVVGYAASVDWLAASLFEICFFSDLLDRPRKLNKNFVKAMLTKAEQPIFKTLRIIIL